MLQEPLRDACFEEKEVPFGRMASATFRWSPRRLGMALARYKNTAKFLTGMRDVAEIGCADGFCSRVLTQEVINLYLYDRDPEWVEEARKGAGDFARSIECVNIVDRMLPRQFNGVYLLDVLEHISPDDEAAALSNIANSLYNDGVCVVGTPSKESQVYARALSREGHVNCKTGDELRRTMGHYFEHVFLFGMNDEMLHMGFLPMCHYLLALCARPIRRPIPPRRLGEDLSKIPLWKGIIKEDD